jgi:fructose-1,6-bisphosphatase I
LGLEGEVNVQGEDQKKLDVITNDLLKRALRFTGRLGVLASEEEDVPVSLTSEKAGVVIDEVGFVYVLLGLIPGSGRGKVHAVFSPMQFSVCQVCGRI